MGRVPVSIAAALCVAFAVAAPARAAGLSGAVGGWSNPIDGARLLDVQARDQTGRLVAATLSVDGQRVGPPASLCPADSRTGCQVESAQLPLNTTAFPDGVHRVVVTISDDQGAIAALLDQQIAFHNAPPANSSSATLTISGGGTVSPEPSPGGSGRGGSGGVESASKSSCTSPILSMSLAQAPLRVSHGVPVLLKSKRYRFRGRLTCVIGGRRRSAPKGAKVELLDVVKGRTVHRPKLTVGASGKLTVVVAYASSRTLEFRYRAVDGKTSIVRVKIRIAARKR
jgi:hypothetical protein